MDEDSGPRVGTRPGSTPIAGESLDEDCQRRLEDLADGLVRLRCGRSDSMRRVKAAYANQPASTAGPERRTCRLLPAAA